MPLADSIQVSNVLTRTSVVDFLGHSGGNATPQYDLALSSLGFISTGFNAVTITDTAILEVMTPGFYARR